MKVVLGSLCLLVVMVFGVVFGLNALAAHGPAGAESPEQLVALIRKYHARKDMKNMMRLYKTDGVPDANIARTEKKLSEYFSRKIEEASLTELQAGALQIFNTAYEIGGQQVGFNLEVVGQVTLAYTGNQQEAFLYGAESEGEDKRYFIALQGPK